MRLEEDNKLLRQQLNNFLNSVNNNGNLVLASSVHNNTSSASVMHAQERRMVSDGNYQTIIAS